MNHVTALMNAMTKEIDGRSRMAEVNGPEPNRAAVRLRAPFELDGNAVSSAERRQREHGHDSGRVGCGRTAGAEFGGSMFKKRSGRSPKTPALKKLFRFGVDLAKGLRQTAFFGAFDFRAQSVQTIELGIKLSFFRRRRVTEASFGVGGREEPSLLSGWSVWLSQRPAPSRGDVIGRTVFVERQSELNGVRCHHDGLH